MQEQRYPFPHDDPSYGPRVEYVIQRIYERVLAPGNGAIDGGAHAGHHTFSLANAVGSSGQVIAVEALEWCIPPLKAAAIAYGMPQVSVVHAALSRSSGQIEFTEVDREPGLSGLRRSPWTPRHLATRKVAVKAVTLDELVSSLPGVHFVKLDLEGGDFDALSGAPATMAIQRPLIVFENSGESAARTYNYSFEDFQSLFNQREYEVFDFLGNPLTRAVWHSIPKGSPSEAIAIPKGSDFYRIIPELSEYASAAGKAFP